jgi:hypothetical protein
MKRHTRRVLDGPGRRVTTGHNFTKTFFFGQNKLGMKVTNTQAYCGTEFVTTVKSIKVKAQLCSLIRHKKVL